MKTPLPASNPSRPWSRAILRQACGLPCWRFLLTLPAAIALWANPAQAQISSTTPQFSLDASTLTAGNIATPVANNGAAGGYWAPEGGNPSVATVGGLNAVTFNGPRLLLTSDSAGTTKQNAPLSLIKLSPGPVKYTVSTWIYRQATGGGEAYLSWAPYQHGTCFQYIGGNGSAVDNWTAGGYVNYNPAPARGEWHFVAVTYDGSAAKLYVDGALQGSGNTGFAADNPAANYPVRIGSGEQATNFSDYLTVNAIRNFGGSISRLDVYDVAATAPEITSLWTANSQSITASATAGGSISPGTVSVITGTDKTFTISRNFGYIVDVVVDGVSEGNISSYTFTNVTTAHTIAANFSLPPPNVLSGNVTAAAGGGATVSVKATATGLPVQQATTDSSGNYSLNVPSGGTYYVCASQTGYTVSANQMVTMSSDQIADFTLIASGRNIPVMENLLFAALGESLPTTQGADTGNWPLRFPFASSATKIGSPTVDYPDSAGPVWAMNHNGSTQDGHRIMQIAQGTVLPINGATIVTVIKPKRVGAVNMYQPVVSVLLGQLELSVRNGDGLIQVGRKGTDWTNYDSAVAIPDGQKTIISLVVQPNGTYNVYTRKLDDTVSTLAFSNGGTADMTSITAQTWYAVDVNIGKGWEGDAWSSFNGDIGDVMVYKTALSDTDRETLESDLYGKYFTIPTYAITASSGPNGSVTPAGVTEVSSMNSQTYNITPITGYGVSDVLVDGVSVGPVTSYTFTDVSAVHTIEASFVPMPVYVVSGQVTDSVSGSPLVGALVFVSSSANASVSPAHVLTTDSGGNYTVNLFDATWYVCASEATHATSVDQAVSVSGADAGGVSFGLVADGKNIPQKDKLLFSVVTESLPTATLAAPWPVFMPLGAPSLTVRGGSPTSTTGGGVTWESNNSANGDGYQFGGTHWDATGQHAIACNGVSIVAVVSPTRSGDGGWSSIVDIFYSTLCLSVKNSTGEIQVRRNPAGSMFGTGYFIPDGQPTIVSLVVQSNGNFIVCANGSQVYANASTTDVTSLIPGTTPYAGGNGGGLFGTYITVGRNWPDGWTTYNGKIGDVFVYTTALPSADRIQLETSLGTKFGITQSPYQQWLATQGNLPSTAGNLGTFAFGLDLTGGASPVTVAPNPTTGEIRYTRRKDTGLGFNYESSTTLGDWQPFTPDAPTPTVTAISTSLEDVTIKIPSGLLADPKLFVRVTVTE